MGRPDTTDILVVGAGIIGISTALELQARHPSSQITVVEKETVPAKHQSGHNSGVIHAGIYYTPGSLKARYCREGLEATEHFCIEHNLRHDKIGKLIVASNETEIDRMIKLGERARSNGISVEDVDEKGLHQMEPRIDGLAALYSPSTGITDYRQITAKMAELFVSRGGTIRYAERILGGTEHASGLKVMTSNGGIETGYAVTCAGLHSDRMIRAFNQEPGYRVVPFRGEFYRIENQPDDLVSHLIYPVPDPERPFLGVHLTRKISGGFTVGPNAVLAFKREGYSLSDVCMNDLASTVSYPGFWRMLVRNFGPAMSELTASISKRAYHKRVQRYCSTVALSDLVPYPAGVRAQAVGPGGDIIDDFLFIQSERCLHVGNAPSPAATAAIPIAKHIADQLGL